MRYSLFYKDSESLFLLLYSINRMTSFGRRRVGTDVSVNVYDLAPMNDFLYHAGLGLYHTGVVINGAEYTFASEGGVFKHTPRAVPNAKFREQINMGTFPGGHAEVQAVVDSLGDEKFGPDDYNILRNNCNHFAAALCWKLLQKKIPGYVNRVADIGVCCSCLIPKQLLEQAPVTNDEAGETSSFLVKAPANRAATTSGGIAPSSVFSGTGSILGGTSSTTTTATVTTDTLTDRREKARKAALARLEQNNDSDRSQQ